MSETAVVTPAESVASPATPAAPAANAAPPAAGSVTASPAVSPESPNLRQLREQYEALKTQHEPWQKIGAKPEEVSSAYQTFSSMSREAQDLGQQLGYDPAEVTEFMAKDPVAVLSHLRQKAAQSQNAPPSAADLRKLAATEAQNVLKPYLEQQNEQLATQAEIRGQNEFKRLLGEHFKEGIAPDVEQYLYSRVEQALLGDHDALQRMMRGQISDVAKYFTQEKDAWLKTVSAFTKAERGRGPGEAAPVKTPPLGRMDAKLSTGQSVRELFNI